MSANPVARISPEEYLELDRRADFRSEYYAGEMFVMAGGSDPHATIILNLGSEIRQALKGSKCRSFISEIRLRVSPERVYTYPDVMVVCGPAKFNDDQADTLLNPILIIEVLSKSTELHDHGVKFEQYRKLDSLEEYVLVSQDRPKLERFRRQFSGQWLLSEYSGIDAICEFESIECRVLMSEIYYNVKFSAESVQQTGLPGLPAASDIEI